MCGGDGQSDPQGASLGTDAVIPRSTGTLRFLGSLAFRHSAPPLTPGRPKNRNALERHTS